MDDAGFIEIDRSTRCGWGGWDFWDYVMSCLGSD
jgi:hypothetical protein